MLVHSRAAHSHFLFRAVLIHISNKLIFPSQWKNHVNMLTVWVTFQGLCADRSKSVSTWLDINKCCEAEDFVCLVLFSWYHGNVGEPTPTSMQRRTEHVKSAWTGPWYVKMSSNYSCQSLTTAKWLSQESNIKVSGCVVSLLCNLGWWHGCHKMHFEVPEFSFQYQRRKMATKELRDRISTWQFFKSFT